MGPSSAQTLVLDNFNQGSATGSVRSGTSWVGNVTQNTGSITVGGTATDVNGWGTTGLSLSLSGLNYVTIVGQRDAGNAATTLKIQFEDVSLNTHVVSINMSAFAVGTLTTVQVPLPAAPASFSTTQVSGWNLGGGNLGLNLLRLTLDLFSLDTVLDPNATLAPMGTFTQGTPLTGSSGLKVNGAGTVVLGAANTFSGAIDVAQGTLELGAAGAIPTGAPLNLASGATFNLAGYAASLGRLEGAGNIALGSANLTVAQGSNTTFSGAITGTGGLVKSGGGTLTLSGTSTYSGATSITGGTLQLNGSAAASAFTIAGGTLSGSGTIGALSVASGGTLSPGNSPGTLNASNTSWGGGGSFTFEVNKGTGASAGTNYDLLAISGSLTITATAGSKFTIAINTLDFSSGLAGVPASFSPTSNYTFAFVTTTSGVVGFDSSKFTLNTSGVDSSLTGVWSVAQNGNALELTYAGSAIPEPSTWATVAGAGALALAIIRRRRHKAPIAR